MGSEMCIRDRLASSAQWRVALGGDLLAAIAAESTELVDEALDTLAELHSSRRYLFDAAAAVTLLIHADDVRLHALADASLSTGAVRLAATEGIGGPSGLTAARVITEIRACASALEAADAQSADRARAARTIFSHFKAPAVIGQMLDRAAASGGGYRGGASLAALGAQLVGGAAIVPLAGAAARGPGRERGDAPGARASGEDDERHEGGGDVRALVDCAYEFLSLLSRGDRRLQATVLKQCAMREHVGRFASRAALSCLATCYDNNIDAAARDAPIVVPWAFAQLDALARARHAARARANAAANDNACEWAASFALMLSAMLVHAGKSAPAIQMRVRARAHRCRRAMRTRARSPPPC